MIVFLSALIHLSFILLLIVFLPVLIHLLFISDVVAFFFDATILLFSSSFIQEEDSKTVYSFRHHRSCAHLHRTKKEAEVLKAERVVAHEGNSNGL